MDALDQNILNEIQDNAKMPLRKLAEKLKVSFVTVMNRIRKLEGEGIIQGYSARINFEKIGYGTHAIIEMRIAKGKLIELEQKIAKTPEVYAVYDTTGETDAVIIAKFTSTRAMDQFLKKIQAFEFVQRTSTKLVLNTIKETQIRL